MTENYFFYFYFIVQLIRLLMSKSKGTITLPPKHHFFSKNYLILFIILPLGTQLNMQGNMHGEVVLVISSELCERSYSYLNT